MTRHPIYRYDFTIPANIIKENELLIICNKHSKKYVFQLELSINNYKHYQGRISLHKKIRLQELIKKKWFPIETHFSPTQTITQGFDYCMKEETRIGRTHKDTDTPRYIPIQYRNKIKNLRPFQQYILDDSYIFNDRIINLIYCPEGNIGKSTIASLCELYKNGIDLPVINDAEKLIQSCCNICMAKNTRNPTPIFIDIPKSFNQEKIGGIFSAIEQIKKGKLYDVRNRYKCWWIDSPNIWVFMNTLPNLKYLSADRWRIWEVDETTYEINRYECYKDI